MKEACRSTIGRRVARGCCDAVRALILEGGSVFEAVPAGAGRSSCVRDRLA